MRTAIISIIFLTVFCISWISVAADFPNKAQHTLQDQGYTEINLTGHQFFGCADDDSFNTGFQAKNFVGNRVKGIICGGSWKGMTVRTF